MWPAIAEWSVLQICVRSSCFILLIICFFHQILNLSNDSFPFNLMHLSNLTVYSYLLTEVFSLFLIRGLFLILFFQERTSL